MVVVAAVPYVMVVLVLDITDTVVVEVRMMCTHAVQSRQLPMQLLDTVDTLASILRTAPEVVDRSLIVNMTKCRAPFHIVQACECSLGAPLRRPDLVASDGGLLLQKLTNIRLD